MSTSYTNTGGTGNRTGLITVSNINFSTPGSGSQSELVDGVASGVTSYFFPNKFNLSGCYLIFDFSAIGSVVITEAKFYQDTARYQGIWKWQGSADGSSWTDIGWAFSLAWNGATQTIKALAGNNTGYKYYRMAGLADQTSSGPWPQEMEFKISAPASAAEYQQPIFFILM